MSGQIQTRRTDAIEKLLLLGATRSAVMVHGSTNLERACTQLLKVFGRTNCPLSKPSLQARYPTRTAVSLRLEFVHGALPANFISKGNAVKLSDSKMKHVQNSII
jgi:hypothetical protein